VEILETRYPMVHEALALNEGSAGPGRNRGGFGYARQFSVASEYMRMSCFIEKEKQQPWGLFGGKPGRNSAILVARAGEDEFRTFPEAFGVACNGKFSDVYLERGDRVRIVTSGGGGYGDPLERDVALVAEDVRQSFISVADATEQYGVVVDEDGRVNEDATRRRREDMRAE
jgi:N-methylhydantoinase B/oxoprolinase/acetone carboxylase alpha subunit